MVITNKYTLLLIVVAATLQGSASFVTNRPLSRPWLDVVASGLQLRNVEKVSTSGQSIASIIQYMSLAEDTYQDDMQEGAAITGENFEHVLDAIYIYEKIFGDLKIPTKFDIPASEPWPVYLHGMKLGKRLERLFTSTHFLTQCPEQVDQLRELGIEPSLKSLVDDWQMIIMSLDVYKSIYGDLRVPSKFTVPESEPWPHLTRGLKLGVRIAAIRSAGRYVKDHPHRKIQLDDMGFEWRLRETTVKMPCSDEEFADVVKAIKTYKDKNDGSIDVPEGYVSGTMNLGTVVEAIRNRDRTYVDGKERSEVLAELGFTWMESGRALYSKRRFELIYDALQVYKELNGDLLVPQAFVVPSSAPWPEDAWDLKLGARVNAIRSQGTLVSNYPERRSMLNELGFVWELPSTARRKRMSEVNTGVVYSEAAAAAIAAAAAAEASATFLQGTHGGTDDVVSAERDRITGLTVPDRMAGQLKSADAYDPSRMFEPVSYREVAAETMRDYLQSREMSMDPDVRQHAHFEGHLNPQQFHTIITRTIPEDDMKNMRKLGYRILEFGAFGWKDVIAALTAYKEAEGHCNVPLDFIIDEHVLAENEHFDSAWEDMKLGHAVASIRVGDAEGLEDPPRKKALDSLGFEWGDKSRYLRFRFLPMVLGLKIYRHLYGFPLPQFDFRVPDEPQWPVWMVDMPLGEWVAVCRIQQDLLKEDWPDRVDILNAMDFLWWLPPGNVPTKYYRSLRN